MGAELPQLRADARGGRRTVLPGSQAGPGDITSGQPGAPLQLAMQVVRAGDCATLANARVDVWHADAVGLYSGYEKQSGVGGISPAAAVGKQYLRGTQFTDAQGNVQFRTIFPSWYGGRTPHVHFKVFLGGKEVVASQIFFPDEITKEVFAAVAAVSRTRVQATDLQRQRPDQAGRVFDRRAAARLIRGHGRARRRVDDERL